MIEGLTKETPYTLLFILLYIISEKDLGYTYKDLFDVDGGIPSLERTNKRYASFDLFDKYYYKHSSIDKLLSGMEQMLDE